MSSPSDSSDSPSAQVSNGQGDKQKCQFVNSECVAKGKWLSLNKINYIDPKGNSRTWEALNRTTKAKDSADCVVVIATLKRVLHYDCLLLVKQYRPPVKAYTIEFPAGLIDEGENAEQAASRELLEETGFSARIKHLSPMTCLDPGTEDCTVVLVTAEIDGDSAENLKPVSHPEESEFIEVILVPTVDLLHRLNEFTQEGAVVDARVYTYAIALTQATKEKKLLPSQK